jgi:hypothetical protein
MIVVWCQSTSYAAEGTRLTSVATWASVEVKTQDSSSVFTIDFLDFFPEKNLAAEP